MDTISQFERDFLQHESESNDISVHSVRIQEFLKDSATAQSIILDYLQQVAQLTVELNLVLAENQQQQQQLHAVPVASGFGGSAAHRTSIIKRLSGSQSNTAFKFGRSMMQRPLPSAAALPSLQSTPGSLHRRGSDGNIKLRKAKQMATTVTVGTAGGKCPVAIEAMIEQPMLRPISFQSDCEGDLKGSDCAHETETSPLSSAPHSPHSPLTAQESAYCTLPLASTSATSSARLTPSDTTAKRERKLSTATNESQSREAVSDVPKASKPAKAGGSLTAPSSSKPAKEKEMRRAQSSGAETRTAKSKTLGSVFGGLFAKRRSRSSHGNANAEEANANANTNANASPRRRMPKFLLNWGGRRLRRHSSSAGSLRKHEAASVARKSAPDQSETKSSASSSKKQYVKSATVTSGKRRMRYVDASSYHVLHDSSSELSVAPLPLTTTASCSTLKCSTNDHARVRSGSMINTSISKKIQLHLAQIATLQIPTVLEMGVDQCSVVTATIPPVAHHIATVSNKKSPDLGCVSRPAAATRQRRTSASRLATATRATLEQEIVDWLSQTRVRLERLLDELSGMLQSSQEKHSVSPFSAATLSRILAGASDEERIRQLRAEYERHLALDRQLKFALMRQHHTILFVIAMLLGRKVDCNQLQQCQRMLPQVGKKRRVRKTDTYRGLRRAHTFSSRLVSNAVYNGVLCAGLLEQATELLLLDAQRFSDDVVRDLLKSLDESNERTQVLLACKKSQTMPTSRGLGLMAGTRQVRTGNRPQSTEFLNAQVGTSPSSSFIVDLAREHRRASRRSSGEGRLELEKDEKLRAALHILLKN